MTRTLTLMTAAFCGTVLSAQTPVTVSTGPSNTTQVWYSLANGEQADMALTDWDMAFEITGFTASIRVNTQKGMRVYKAPYAVNDWSAVDTAGMGANWTQVHDSDTSWSHGALNQELTSNEFDLGWGVYNMITHSVIGDSLFVVRKADGDWVKLRIDALATNVYTFTYANVDGSNEQTVMLNKAAHMGKNFGYFSFTGNSVFDPEPLSEAWDLVFTKYIAYVPTAYPVTGVLHNKGVSVLQIDGVPNDLAQWTGQAFDPYINAIGSDWKTYDMQLMQYVISADRTYFVKDKQDNIWKLVFTDFGGGATGDISFTQELISATAIAENSAHSNAVKVFPMPVHGTAQLVFDMPVNEVDAQLVDMSGRVVLRHTYTGLNRNSQRTLDIEGIPSGMYALRVIGAQFSYSTPLIVE